MDPKEFGKFLEGLRGKLPLREVSKKIGLSHTYIRDLELGMNRKTKAPIHPSPDTLKRLSNAYNYDYEELLIMAGVLEGSNEEGKDALSELINRKVSQMKPETKIHLLKYIDLIDDDLK